MREGREREGVGLNELAGGKLPLAEGVAQGLRAERQDVLPTGRDYLCRALVIQRRERRQ